MGKHAESIYNQIRKDNLNELPDEQKIEYKLKKVDEIIETIGNKENRYIFYCPDIPFPVGTVKSIYDTVIVLKDLGYNVHILHESKDYKASWLNVYSDKIKHLSFFYLKDGKKEKNKNFEFNFQPSDTVIIPDGFWTVMQGLEQAKNIQKIVYVMGYGGIATVEPGLSWSYLGFTEAMVVSDRLISDYKKVWPEINYRKQRYKIDQEIFKSKDPDLKKPLISLSFRSREDAQRLINIFYNAYPFLDVFQFNIVKNKKVTEYAEELAESCLFVLSDSKSGHPQWPLEALSCNTLTMLVDGRGYDHLYDNDAILFLERDDDFYIAEKIAEYCYSWLQTNHFNDVYNKDILKEYSQEEFIKEIVSNFRYYQDKINERFAAYKNNILKEITNEN